MYLVTGASGFVGRHLLERLCPLAHARGERVVVLCRSRAAWAREAWAAALTPQLRVVEGDVTDVARWQNEVQDTPLQGIFHLAAIVQHSRRQPAHNNEVNVEGTRAIARLGARLGVRTVFLSSSGVVGCSPRAEDAPTEEAPYCEAQVARWPYYAGKIAAERAARAEAPAPGALVVLRPPVLLGPRDHRFRSTSHVVRLLRGRLPFVLAGGFHFVDVRDVADALVRAMQHSAPADVYHLPGHTAPIPKFFAELAKLADVRPPRGTLGVGLSRTLGPGLVARRPRLELRRQARRRDAARHRGLDPRPPRRLRLTRRGRRAG